MSAPARKRPASCANRPGPLMPASRQRALSSPAPRAPWHPAASIAASACRTSRQKPLTACEIRHRAGLRLLWLGWRLRGASCG
jgi:hypothetical protein